MFHRKPRGRLPSKANQQRIASSDEICWVVSFIKILRHQHRDCGPARIHPSRQPAHHPTSYMGATTPKASTLLARLPNTKIKVSYNPEHERLHAKAYLSCATAASTPATSLVQYRARPRPTAWKEHGNHTREVGHIMNKFRNHK